MLFGKIGVAFVYNFAFRKYDDGGGLQLPKIGGSQIKLRGRQPRKTGAVVWQWVVSFKEAVPPGGWGWGWDAAQHLSYRIMDVLIFSDWSLITGRRGGLPNKRGGWGM